MTAIRLKDGTEIISVSNEYGHEILHDEDSHSVNGNLWVYRNTCGIACIAVADSFESAYETVIDTLPPIDDTDVPEAYGFYSDNAQDELDKAEKIGEETGEYPELQEGYQHQSNITGSGIVSTDLNGEALEELTVELFRKLKLKIQIRTY